MNQDHNAARLRLPTAIELEQSTKLLSGGIRYTKYGRDDFFEGPKQALIDAGYALTEWFPCSPILDKHGRTKRSFFILDDNGKRITLRDMGNGRWCLWRPVSGEECERRHREGPAQDDGEALAAILKTLPPFVPGSMSDSERYHMRILRALDAGRRGALTILAASLLISDSKRRELDQPKPARPGLRLVIDNDQARP
jgi:hypothetical protein